MSEPIIFRDLPATFPEEDKYKKQDCMEGVQVDELEEFDVVVVETKHHTYEITVINPTTAEVLIRGGERFPEQTPALVLGSMGQSFFKLRGIYAGFSVELLSGGRRIITSRVRRIERKPALASL
jgi:hypothetical protein